MKPHGSKIIAWNRSLKFKLHFLPNSTLLVKSSVSAL